MCHTSSFSLKRMRYCQAKGANYPWKIIPACLMTAWNQRHCLILFRDHDDDRGTVHGIICWFVEILRLRGDPTEGGSAVYQRVRDHLSLYSLACPTIK